MCMYSRYGLTEAHDQMVPACLHGDYNNGLMRGEWGWTSGLLVADCDAIADAYQTHHYVSDAGNASALGVLGGCDLDCGATYSDPTGLPAALQSGLLNESSVDTALTRVFTTRIAVGDLDDPALPWLQPYTSINGSWLDTPQHRQLSYEASQQAITLLSNDDRVLPLQLPAAGGPLRIACVGPVCADSLIHMGSKHDYCPPFMQSFMDGLNALPKSQATVTTAPGCGISDSSTKGFQEAFKVAKAADVVLVALGIDGSIEGEARDRKYIGLPQVQQDFLEQLAEELQGMGDNAPAMVVLGTSGGSLSLDWARANASTAVATMELGQYAGDALVDVLLGRFNPQGSLPWTVYPSGYVNEVAMSNMSMRAGPGRTFRYYKGTPLWAFGHSGAYHAFEAASRSALVDAGKEVGGADFQAEGGIRCSAPASVAEMDVLRLLRTEEGREGAVRPTSAVGCATGQSGLGAGSIHPSVDVVVSLHREHFAMDGRSAVPSRERVFDWAAAARGGSVNVAHRRAGGGWEAVSCEIRPGAAEANRGPGDADPASLPLEFLTSVSGRPAAGLEGRELPATAGRALHAFVARTGGDSHAEEGRGVGPRVELASIDLLSVPVDGSSTATALASLWRTPADGLQDGSWCSMCGVEAPGHTNNQTVVRAEKASGIPLHTRSDVLPGAYVAWLGGDAATLDQGLVPLPGRGLLGGAWERVSVAVIEVRGD